MNPNKSYFSSKNTYIIFIIATVLNQFADYWFVQSAFKAIRATVFVLVLSAVIKLSKKSIVDWVTLIIAVVVLGLTIFTNIPLFIYVLVAGFIGIFVNWFKTKKVKTEPIEEIQEESTSEGEVE